MKLAGVSWKMGQTLLPEHFQAQEEALINNSILRTSIRGLPNVGLAKLIWNKSLLAEGIVSIQAITIIMQSGFLLDVPGNAGVSAFNLNTPGSINVSVYCHLTKYVPSGDSLQASTVIKLDNVQRMMYQVVLSSESNISSAIETMKLAEFDKDAEGNWRLSDNYIPPLLKVGKSPFLLDMIRELMQNVNVFHRNLTQEVTASFLSGESLFNAKQCLKSVYQVERFLLNILSEVNIHPYYLYEALKVFYTEVCFYKNSIPEEITSPYTHNQLNDCFKKIYEPLMKLMKVAQVHSPYLSFECNNSMHSIKLPKNVLEAKEVYFLIQKGHINENILPESLKLASSLRVSLVRQMSLQGISLQKIDRPPFQHSFGAEVDFFLIVEGDEWDYALRELSIGFYDSDKLKGTKFYIYWRMS